MKKRNFFFESRKSLIFLLIKKNKLKIVYPTSSFTYADENPSINRIWGCLLTLPQTYEVPLIVPELYKCNKCGSFKTPQDSRCPICNPKEFYNDMGTLSFLDILIRREKTKKESLTVCFAFDMSSPHSVLQQIVYTLASPDFLKEFADYKFFFVFLGKLPIFVTKKFGSDNLSIDKFPNDSDYEFFSAENLADSLVSSFQVVFAMINDKKSTSSSFDNLFIELTNVKFDHLFLFYSFQPLPNNVVCDFSVHCIEIVNSQNPVGTIFSPLINQWTHCTINRCTPFLINYLKSRANQFLSRSIKIFIRSSAEIEISWISGNKSDTTVQKNAATVYLAHYPIDYMLSATFQATNKYFSRHFFSLQVVYEFSDGCSVVVNRAWRKAHNITEWASSINIAPFCIMFMKQKVAHFVRNYTNKSKYYLFDKKKKTSDFWEISMKKIIAPSFKIAQKVLILFHSLFISNASVLNEQIRLEIIFLAMTKGFNYLGTLFNSLYDLSGNEVVFPFPPFYFVKESEKDQIGNIEQQIDLPTAVLILLDDEFEKLRKQICFELEKIADSLVQ